MRLRKKDQKNLEDFLALLETKKMRGELRGSAASGNPDYKDLDLNVWDAEERGPGYRLGREAINKFLKYLGIKKVDFSTPIPATWCEGRWQFDYKGTKFDLMYTPTGPRFQGYEKTPEKKEQQKK